MRRPELPPFAFCFVVVSLVFTMVSIAPARAQVNDPFAVPPGLESSVAFWVDVYATWSVDEVTFHDRDDVGIVYHTMTQKKSENRRQYRANESVQDRVRAKYRAILLRLAEADLDVDVLNDEERRVYAAFGGGVTPARLRRAADRIRVQRGLRERFRAGLVDADRYHPHILPVLREENVPEQIAWLPMVESTFNLKARSAVGAAGVWQFMPATARKYLTVNRTIDERLDPILAARGAARLLKDNMKGLGSWPLALTAYNHGYYGMRRAVRQVGTTDYMKIRERYEGPAFGFASKNFYAEFLAAIEVAMNRAQYFAEDEPHEQLVFDVVRMPTSMPLRDVATAVGVDAEDLWLLNPSLTSRVRRGQRNLPAGFALRVPAGLGGDAPIQLASAVAARTGGRQVRSAPGGGGAGLYQVQRGDTLYSIAARYGMSVTQLVSLNDIDDRNHIEIGQLLRVGG